MMNLDEQVKLFNKHLENGGDKEIWSSELIDSLLNVKPDDQGNVIPESVDFNVRIALKTFISGQMIEPLNTGQRLVEYESFLQKSVFFNQKRIDSKEELEAFIIEYGNSANLIYRGVGEARWRLYSSLQRHWILNSYYDLDIDFKDFLKDVITNGRSMFGETLSNFLTMNNIDPENDLAILSFIQHHGQPTPLLDWTEDVGNALYFAIDGINLSSGNNEIDQYFSLYILDGDFFSEKGIKRIMEEKIKGYSDKLKETLVEVAKSKGLEQDTYDRLFSKNVLKEMTLMQIGNKFASALTEVELLINLPFAFFSDSIDDSVTFGLNNNLRITNQRGVFTWNSSPILPLEHVILEEYNQSFTELPDESACTCINIRKDLVKDVRGFLDDNGINEDYIYPNPELLSKQSFGKTLKSFGLD